MVNEEVTALGSRNGAACKNCHIAEDADEKNITTHSQTNSSSIFMINFFAASSLHSSQGLKCCQKHMTKVYQFHIKSALDTILDTSLDLKYLTFRKWQEMAFCLQSYLIFRPYELLFYYLY